MQDYEQLLERLHQAHVAARTRGTDVTLTEQDAGALASLARMGVGTWRTMCLPIDLPDGWVKKPDGLARHPDSGAEVTIDDDRIVITSSAGAIYSAPIEVIHHCETEARFKTNAARRGDR